MPAGAATGLSEWLMRVQFDAGRWCPVDISAYGPR
jgi:hypothetical protein